MSDSADDYIDSLTQMGYVDDRDFAPEHTFVYQHGYKDGKELRRVSHHGHNYILGYLKGASEASGRELTWDDVQEYFRQKEKQKELEESGWK